MAELNVDDTIVALATANGRGLRSIVRLSGPQSLEFVRSLVATSSDWPEGLDARWLDAELKLHSDSFRKFDTIANLSKSGEDRAVLWPARVYVWPDRRSFTRQPSVEIHTRSNPWFVDRMIQQLVGAGARLARPGEFTLRAFLAGRIDLTQAEAVLGTIDAVGDRELEVSLQQLSGGLGGLLMGLRGRLLNLLAHLEAGLDFVEEDIEFIDQETLCNTISEVKDEVQSVANTLNSRGSSGTVAKVVLFGKPNAGKSSLYNAILNRSAAIVSDVAGTTRDYVSAQIDLGGVACELIDTAGVDEAQVADALDQRAQALTNEVAEQASLLIHCVDGTKVDFSPDLSADEHGQAADVVQVLTKSDLVNPDAKSARLVSVSMPPTCCVSSTTGEGIEALRETIRNKLSDGEGREGAVVSTAARSRASLLEAIERLDTAYEAASESWGEEVVAAEVRQALDALGQVTGEIYTDDILDRVFSQFCIGK